MSPIADRKTLNEHLFSLAAHLSLDVATRDRGCGYTDFSLHGTDAGIAALGRVLKRAGFAHTITHNALFTTLIVRYVWTPGAINGQKNR